MNRCLAAVILLLAASNCLALVGFSPDGSIAFSEGATIVLQGVATDGGSGGAGGWVNATMTSNTAPSPNEVSDGSISADAWKWFDHDSGTFADLQSFGWIKFDFGAGNSEVVDRFKLKNKSGAGLADYTFSGSNNDVDWTSLDTGTPADTETEQEFPFSNSTAYRYYMLEWTTTHDGGLMLGEVYEVKLWKD